MGFGAMFPSAERCWLEASPDKSLRLDPTHKMSGGEGDARLVVRRESDATTVVIFVRLIQLGRISITTRDGVYEMGLGSVAMANLLTIYAWSHSES